MGRVKRRTREPEEQIPRARPGLDHPAEPLAQPVSTLEAFHRRFVERIRQQELVDSLQALEAKQAALLDLATRGAAEKLRLKKAGDLGGRRPKVDPVVLDAEVDRYRAEHPNEKPGVAEIEVALAHRVDESTVRRARKRLRKGSAGRT